MNNPRYQEQDFQDSCNGEAWEEEEEEKIVESLPHPFTYPKAGEWFVSHFQSIVFV